MVGAVRNFTGPPSRRIELLVGGAARGCSASDDSCGSRAVSLLLHALRSAFGDAAVVLIDGRSASPPRVDADFLTLACAPRLVIGAGSFAMFAALASRGEVRLPNCVVSNKAFHGSSRPGEETPAACFTSGWPRMPAGWSTYDFPRCQSHCRSHRRAARVGGRLPLPARLNRTRGTS